VPVARPALCWLPLPEVLQRASVSTSCPDPVGSQLGKPGADQPASNTTQHASTCWPGDGLRTPRHIANRVSATCRRRDAPPLLGTSRRIRTVPRDRGLRSPFKSAELQVGEKA